MLTQWAFGVQVTNHQELPPCPTFGWASAVLEVHDVLPDLNEWVGVSWVSVLHDFVNGRNCLVIAVVKTESFVAVLDKKYMVVWHCIVF